MYEIKLKSRKTESVSEIVERLHLFIRQFLLLLFSLFDVSASLHLFFSLVTSILFSCRWLSIGVKSWMGNCFLNYSCECCGLSTSTPVVELYKRCDLLMDSPEISLETLFCFVNVMNRYVRADARTRGIYDDTKYQKWNLRYEHC